MTDAGNDFGPSTQYGNRLKIYFSFYFIRFFV